MLASNIAIYQEIAIRVFRTAHELSMRTVAIYSNEDRLSMHRYKVCFEFQLGCVICKDGGSALFVLLVRYGV